MYIVPIELRNRYSCSSMATLIEHFPQIEPALRLKEQRWIKVIDRIAQNGIVGLVLRSASDDHWIFISPDVKPGMFRYSAFDLKGFFGDGVRTTPERVLLDVFTDGYQIIENSTKLDQIAALWPINH